MTTFSKTALWAESFSAILEKNETNNVLEEGESL